MNRFDLNMAELIPAFFYGGRPATNGPSLLFSKIGHIVTHGGCERWDVYLDDVFVQKVGCELFEDLWSLGSKIKSLLESGTHARERESDHWLDEPWSHDLKRDGWGMDSRYSVRIVPGHVLSLVSTPLVRETKSEEYRYTRVPDIISCWLRDIYKGKGAMGRHMSYDGDLFYVREPLKGVSLLPRKILMRRIGDLVCLRMMPDQIYSKTKLARRLVYTSGIDYVEVMEPGLVPLAEDPSPFNRERILENLRGMDEFILEVRDSVLRTKRIYTCAWTGKTLVKLVKDFSSYAKVMGLEDGEMTPSMSLEEAESMAREAKTVLETKAVLDKL